MRVGITGSEGFTGRYLLREVEQRDWRPILLTADLRDAEMLDAEIAGNELDAVVHLAALAFVASDDWQSFYTVNQLGAFNLLASVARHHPGAICLLASSAQVYGSAAQGIVNEATTCEPNNHYAISKYAMELGAQLWRDEIDIRIARPFNYTGVGQEERYLIPKIVAHFASRSPTIELGNITVLRDFGDVRDVSRTYCELLACPHQSLLTNVASGRLTSISEILATLTEITGHELEIKQNPAFMRKNEVEELGGDTSHLKSLLSDWQPSGLKDLLSWMVREAKN